MTRYRCRGPVRIHTMPDGTIIPTKERVGCGRDTTDLILSVPFDGEVHEVTCPTCGTITSVRNTPKD